MGSSSASASKIRLNKFDDLFGSNEGQEVENGGLRHLPLSELSPFKDHPFRVVDDDRMRELVESVREHGVLVPGIARRKGGGYELIAGHRRKLAAELAGLKEMPVFVREYSDDESIVVMVDSNIQREDILPSEKARAYRMKYEATKRQGSRNGGLSLDRIGERAGESGKTVQRYIWLSRLCDGLMELCDRKKIGFLQGVDLSFLSGEEQQWVLDGLLGNGCRITAAQSRKLKDLSKGGALTQDAVAQALSGQGEATRKYVLKGDVLARYFPPDCKEEQIGQVICQLLEEWKNRRDKDGRD